ncbi:hypothetical protein BDQ12DRAFT_679374 [Crucibulum laeve]|uniref:ATP-dependent DNA helicase n=1 Tax=Crucibulum laeve TaxID=68775 RepID=A0A5C3M9J4_9AGAR|nr:hypothetical protein BDQ12DRAFT_679374 [Crucibulum laeve]
MSSDGYFDDDLDDAVFEELDAIEAAHPPPGKQPPVAGPSHIPAKPILPKPIAKEDSFYDLTFDFDDSELDKIDDLVVDVYAGTTGARPSKPSRTASKDMIQTTLFGDKVQPETSTSNPRSQLPRSQLQRSHSTSRNPFGQRARKTKQWDQTAFAKSGLKKAKSKDKGKRRAKYGDEDEDEDEEMEFEQFPAPFVSGQPPPMKLQPDLLEAKHWIYPTNKPKRNYQFNIVKNCLFDNTIVALPTGLGKTFIAGVVMLNYYRWFPEGKVVFVAPTKPLVAQQIDACHQTCGIPGSDASELTGQVPKPTRARLWREKRIFYMTPQTLINDLTTENCDPRDIVLLVVDEAHRATGDYAYNQVVRFLMAKNPHFRLLALTATPGSNPDAVQALVDGLHISRIEIRDEGSLDLKQYIHQKTIKQHIINMNEDVNKIKETLGELMDTFMTPLKQRGILSPYEQSYTLHPFRAQKKMSELSRDQSWAFPSLSNLGKLARGMQYLIEGTIGMCYTYLKEISLEKENDEESAPGKKKAPPDRNKKLRTNPLFQAVMRELETQRCRGFVFHPKMDRLKALILQHFGEIHAESDATLEDISKQTRAMVFVTFREAVDEIVEALNFEKPLVRAHKFIGQGTDKQGKKGLGQREQLDIIERFKAGEFNVLVATSIGEEGLDIGEVDLIVCYDAQKTPIRMLQRSGRTGRKRAGVVHVLLAEGREETNFDKAKSSYKEVQKTIVRGEQLELYGDVERLLPDHIRPECLEKTMEIQEYAREDSRKKTSSTASCGSPSKGTKRKRNDDIGRNIPMGASTGFVSVSDLLVKSGKKRAKVAIPKNLDEAGQDDEDDEAIEAGVFAAPRRTKSAGNTSQNPSKTTSKLRKAATIGGTKAPTKRKKNKEVKLSSSQFSQKGVDDSDDLEIERGILLSPLKPSTARSKTLSPTPDIDVSVAETVIELSDSAPEREPSPCAETTGAQSMAWLIDDDEDPDIEIVDSSPILSKRGISLKSPATPNESMEVSQPFTVKKTTARQYEKRPVTSYNDISSVDDSIELLDPPTPGSATSGHQTEQLPDESVEFSISGRSAPPWDTPSSPIIPVPSRKDDQNGHHNNDMPPPALPRRFAPPSPDGDIAFPAPSFPVRPAGRQGRRRIVFTEEFDSPSFEMPSPSQRRLKRQVESTPAPKRSKAKRAKPSILARNPNPLFDAEADHSGDEVSEGDSNSEDDVETEYDRQFIRDSPLTQASPSYDQTMAYRQSLFTQAPAGSRAPAFANRPVRPTVFGAGPARPRRPQFALPSSSPPPPDNELDNYDIGSFVVDDDAEISYIDDSSEM